MSPKNILYVVTRLPWPLIGGDKVHIYNYLKELKKRGYNITLVTLVRDDDDLEGAIEHNEFYTKLIPVKYNKKLAYIKAAKALFNQNPFIVEYYYNKKMQKVIDEEIKTGNYDVVIGYMIRSVPYLKNLKSKNKNIKIIIHLCDAISLMYSRRIKQMKGFYQKLKIWIEQKRVKRYEELACKISDKQIILSDIDKEYLSGFCKSKDKMQVINWATDTEFFAPQNAELKNNICFVGTMHYIPNIEAVLYFIDEIFPIVKAQIPDVKFKIIGTNPKKELFEYIKNIEGVEITGRVDDVREYMKDCKVSICPTRIVAGIQTKLLEAMAMGIPVVTTKESAAEMNPPEGVLLISENTNDFAQNIIKVMKDKKLHDDISKASREHILKYFIWDKIGDDWDKMINEVING